MLQNNEPNYTKVHHYLRKKYGLTNSACYILGYIHSVSHSDKYHSLKIEAYGERVGVARSTTYNAINSLKSKGLVRENEFGELCSTQMWADEIALIESKIRKP